MPRKARIEVFRTGTFTPMEGEAVTYSAADLRAVADGYDPETAPAPIVVGHPATDAPAYGWVESFDYDATVDRLFATVGEIDASFAEAVKAGRYKKVSLSFHPPQSSANPVPGTWYPKHVGFLGGRAPAVSGLKNVQFAAEPSMTFTCDFSDRSAEETVGILRGLRDFLIDKFGIEDADRALPSYRIDWLETVAESSEFSAPPSRPSPKEPEVSNNQTAFAQREAEFSAREERLKSREREIAHADHVSFAEKLVADGKLLPALKDRVVSIFDGLPADHAVSFAAGEAATPIATALREVFEALPKVVSFGELDLPEETAAHAVHFASDGRAVDTGSLERHQRALEFQRKNPGTGYIDAVKAVS